MRSESSLQRFPRSRLPVVRATRKKGARRRVSRDLERQSAFPTSISAQETGLDLHPPMRPPNRRRLLVHQMPVRANRSTAVRKSLGLDWSGLQILLMASLVFTWSRFPIGFL